MNSTSLEASVASRVSRLGEAIAELLDHPQHPVVLLNPLLGRERECLLDQGDVDLGAHIHQPTIRQHAPDRDVLDLWRLTPYRRRGAELVFDDARVNASRSDVDWRDMRPCVVAGKKAKARTSSAGILGPGDIVAVPLPNGCYGAFCVVDTYEDLGTHFFVIDGFWKRPPAAKALRTPRAMALPLGQRDPLPGRENVWKGWFRDVAPEDFLAIGRVPLTASLRRHAGGQGTMIFQSAEDFRANLYKQWRWLHDRKALEAEWAAARAAYEREQARRAANRKATNSLSKMLRERPFAHWREHWPARAVNAVHAAFQTATKALLALGPRATRRSKEALFRQLIAALNAIYDREGCIETVEREELVARIEELAGLVGLRNTDERLTGDRLW